MKDKIISSYDARRKLSLFLKLRKNKIINEEMIKKFNKLIDNDLEDNFKSSNRMTIDEGDIRRQKMTEHALECLKTGFFVSLEFENLVIRLAEIKGFETVGNNTNTTHIMILKNGESKEIETIDLRLLEKIFV